MESLWIIPAIDIAFYIGSGNFSRHVPASMNTLHFERVKEAFGHGAIVAVPWATHTLNHAETLEQTAISSTRVLHATIGVMNEVRR